MKKKEFWMVHPGGFLLREYLQPMGIELKDVENEVGLPVSLLEDFTQEKMSVTPEIAIGLADFFNVEPEFWMGLQSQHDLRAAGYVRKIPVVPSIINKYLGSSLK